MQRKSESETSADVHAAAASGIAGAGTALPHADTIQASFGRHSVAGVTAHTGGAAAEASAAMGAEAYATGAHIAFGSSAPSLHTAAHEAAHVVQQRGGVSLKGGVGEAGDAWERHADAVADRVVAGQSAEDLLDPVAGRGGAAAVQRKPGDPFKPTFVSTPDPLKALLDDDAAMNLSVSNARTAPKGTTFKWSWGALDDSKLTKRSLIPTDGPSTTAVVHTKAPGSTALPAQIEIGGGAAPATVDVAPVPRVVVATPTVSVTRKVKPGKYSKNDVANLAPGDTLSLTLDFAGYGDPRAKLGDKQLFKYVLDALSILDKEDHPFQDKPLVWIDKHTAVLDVYCHHAGTGVLSLLLALPGAAVHFEQVQLKATSSWKFFRDRCGAATDRHIRLLGMADAFLHGCFINYKQAYDSFQAVIDAHSARRKLTNDIMLGIVFAGLGGVIGGAVGAFANAKFTSDQVKAGAGIMAAIANSKAAVATVTDGIKDIAKFGARLPQRVAGGDPLPSGANKVPAVDPATWYATLATAKANEQTRMAKVIEDWKEASIDAEARGEEAELDFDPINAVTESMKLGDDPVTSLVAPPGAITYEKNMWEVWVGKYGYEVVHYAESSGNSSIIPPGGIHLAEEQIPSEHDAELRRIDAKLRELNIDASWLTDTLERARKPVAEEAHKRNAADEAERKAQEDARNRPRTLEDYQD